MTKKNKTTNIKELIHNIKEVYGSESCFYGEPDKYGSLSVMPTRIKALNDALGVGGIPRGRIIEIYGNEGSGKSTLAYELMGDRQALGETVALIDTEHALDNNWSKICGIDLTKLIISQPDYAEQALEICEMLVRSGSVDLIVIDSVAALVPKAEIEGTMEDVNIGLQARIISQALRKLTAVVSKSKTTIIFINQLRDKIGSFFGSPETTPGGKALKFYSSIRLNIKSVGKIKKQIKGKEKCVGHNIKCVVAKNKVAPAFTIAEFCFIYDKGLFDLKGEPKNEKE